MLVGNILEYLTGQHSELAALVAREQRGAFIDTSAHPREAMMA
jgi:hypothetical protein